MIRCETCGYMGDHMETCPVCRSKEIVSTNSNSPKEEAVKLLCGLIDVTTMSTKGKLAKQIVDLVMP